MEPRAVRIIIQWAMAQLEMFGAFNELDLKGCGSNK